MRFKRVYVEITNTCNLQCSFCIQNQRTPQAMSMEQFTHVIQQIAGCTRYVYLHVLGEPLSHPLLDAFLSVCEQYGLYVNLTTNGTLLKEKAEILTRHSIRQLNVSLHSFPQHRQTHYLQDVFQVCEKLAAQNVYINYRLWSLGKQGMDPSNLQVLKQVLLHYDKTLQEEAKRLQRIPLAEHISLHFEEVFSWPSLAQPFVNDKGRCLGMKDMCAVLSNGDVVPCCLDSKGECVLGNLFESDMEEILSSPRAKAIVDGFQRFHIEEELCRHCSYRLRFYRLS
ncbi:radical SAM/SPASM domain-containing protein [Amedibacillus dolichus]|uniref:Radical SAM/SPASM domain-containing protein n=1 Tax=Amedibacillus dolichus TaxID=31971 RepID=A0A415PIE1_9FIRM|nr:radical SAM protein [Amedibacillus dolichus]RHM12503.1 radical SAM/SPASM domain-containing protein [Amedibacillus dolichus]